MNLVEDCRQVGAIYGIHPRKHAITKHFCFRETATAQVIIRLCWFWLFQFVLFACTQIRFLWIQFYQTFCNYSPRDDPHQCKSLLCNWSKYAENVVFGGREKKMYRFYLNHACSCWNVWINWIFVIISLKKMTILIKIRKFTARNENRNKTNFNS